MHAVRQMLEEAPEPAVGGAGGRRSEDGRTGGVLRAHGSGDADHARRVPLWCTPKDDGVPLHDVVVEGCARHSLGRVRLDALEVAHQPASCSRAHRASKRTRGERRGGGLARATAFRPARCRKKTAFLLLCWKRCAPRSRSWLVCGRNHGTRSGTCGTCRNSPCEHLRSLCLFILINSMFVGNESKFQELPQRTIHNSKPSQQAAGAPRKRTSPSEGAASRAATE